MTIRKAKIEDIPQIVKLLYQVEDVHRQGRPDLFRLNGKKYNQKQLIEILNDPQRPVFAAADEEDVMIGYAFCVFERHKNEGALNDFTGLYIDDLCVEQNLRGQHIGKQIYEYVKKFAKEKGCYNVTLNVWECNPKAKEFYLSMGFKPYKTAMEVIL